MLVHYFIWSSLAAAILAGLFNAAFFFVSGRQLSETKLTKKGLVVFTVAHGIKTAFITFLIAFFVAAVTYPMFAHYG